MTKYQTLHVKTSDLDPNAGYTRNQPMITVTYNCQECGSLRSHEQLPGKTPKYCLNGDGTKTECEKKANRRRVATHRANKKT